MDKLGVDYAVFGTKIPRRLAMKRLSPVSRILALALLVGMAASPAAADIIIDDFTVGVTLTLNSGSSGTVQDSVAAPVLGGFTELSATKNNVAGTLVITTTPGVYDYASSSVPAGGSATITWDGVNNNALDTTGLGGFDLTGGGTNNAFAGVLRGDDSPGAAMTITVWTGGVPSSAVIPIPDSLSFTPFSAAFSSFSGSPNFANVGAIRVQFNGTPNQDFQFDAFRVTGPTAAVPEPSSLFLLGFGAVALFLRRRRQC